jgi:hypothetical protein
MQNMCTRAGGTERELLRDSEMPALITLTNPLLLPYRSEKMGVFGRAPANCQRARKFPQKWALKIPWFGGDSFAVDDQP